MQHSREKQLIVCDYFRNEVTVMQAITIKPRKRFKRKYEKAYSTTHNQ